MVDRFRLDGELYEFAEPEHVSLRTYFQLRTDPASEYFDVSYGNIARLVGEFHKIQGSGGGAFSQHPEGPEILTVVIWLAMLRKRQDAGDYAYLPLSAALDANIGTFEVLPDSGKAQPRKGRTATGSGRRSEPNAT